jgi:hypothetical protein
MDLALFVGRTVGDHPKGGPKRVERNLLGLLAGLIVALTAADHWSTYICLTEVVPGWHASEANPLAAWLFGSFGLVPGLAIDTAVTLSAVGMLLQTRLVPPRAKGACLLLLVVTTAFAVLNNLDALATLGLTPFGRG